MSRVERIKSLASEGLTVSQIAVQLGIPYQVVFDYAKRYDIPVTKKTIAPKVEPTPELHKKIDDLMKKGHSRANVARLLGLTNHQLKMLKPLWVSYRILQPNAKPPRQSKDVLKTYNDFFIKRSVKTNPYGIAGY